MLRVFFKSGFFKSNAHALRHLEYLNRQGPLFSGTREVNLEDSQTDIEKFSEAPKRWFVYSLTREDQQRLQIDRGYFQDLMEAQRLVWAKAYNIPPDRLHICASFHDVAHHPHIHVVLHGETASDGFIVQRSGQELGEAFRRCRETVKGAITQEIFRGDTEGIKADKGRHRQELNAQLEKLLLEIGRTSHPIHPQTREALAALAGELAKLPGKHQYGYLPPRLKARVDTLLQDLVSVDRSLRSLFELYRKNQRELVKHQYVGKDATLAKKMKEWEESFFHPTKGGDTRRHNLIIQAAEAYGDGLAGSQLPEPTAGSNAWKSEEPGLTTAAEQVLTRTKAGHNKKKNELTKPAELPPSPEMRALMSKARASLERRLKKGTVLYTALRTQLLKIHEKIDPTQEYRYTNLPTAAKMMVDETVQQLMQQPAVRRMLKAAGCAEPDLSVLREWVTEYACAATKEQPVDLSMPQKRRVRYKFFCAFDGALCRALNDPARRAACLALAQSCLGDVPEKIQEEEETERPSYWKLNQAERASLDEWATGLLTENEALHSAAKDAAAMFGKENWLPKQLEKGWLQNIMMERLDEWRQTPDKPIEPKYTERYTPKTLDAVARNLLYLIASTMRDDMSRACPQTSHLRPAKKFRKKRIHHTTIEEKAQDDVRTY